MPFDSYTPLVAAYQKSSTKTTTSSDTNEDASEWRIIVGGKPSLVQVSRGYSSKYFRKANGQSALPSDAYFTLVNQLQAISKSVQWKLQGVFFLLYVLGLTCPLLVLAFIADSLDDENADAGDAGDNDDAGNVDGDDNGESSIPKWSVIVALLVSFAHCFGIWHIVSTRIYRSMDTALEDLAAQKKGEFYQAYGVEIGYRQMKCYWRSIQEKSCVWLRGNERHPEDEEDPEASSSAAAAASTFDASKDYPHIFIYLQVPGDVAISENKYHSSLVYDPETWKLIQETHRTHSSSPVVRALLLAVAIPIFLYLVFFSFFAARWGILIAVGVFALMIGVLFVSVRCLDQWLVKQFYKAAEAVTASLNDPSEARGTTGFALRLETSPLPFRKGATSRRYVLSKATADDAGLERDTTISSSAVGAGLVQVV